MPTITTTYPGAAPTLVRVFADDGTLLLAGEVVPADADAGTEEMLKLWRAALSPRSLRNSARATLRDAIAELAADDLADNERITEIVVYSDNPDGSKREEGTVSEAVAGGSVRWVDADAIAGHITVAPAIWAAFFAKFDADPADDIVVTEDLAV